LDTSKAKIAGLGLETKMNCTFTANNAIQTVIEGLRAAGFPVLDLTGCGVDTLHLAVMVGDGLTVNMQVFEEAEPSKLSPQVTGQIFRAVRNLQEALETANYYEEVFKGDITLYDRLHLIQAPSLAFKNG
jgi:hypothetical protein